MCRTVPPEGECFFVSVAEIPPLELLSRDGLGEPEALRAVAVQRAEELHLLLSLDALTDDVVAQPFDQMHDLPQKIGAPRVGPAPGQRFGSNDREILGRELGLEVQFELTVLKRLRQAAQQLTGQGLLDLQLFVKLDSRHAGVAVHLLAGKICLVDGGRGAQAAGLNGVHTHPYPQAYLRVMLGLILLKSVAEVMPRLTAFTARCLLR